MTNYAGRAFVLKVGTISGGTTVADCKAHSLKINNEQVDITNKSSAGWRTLLAGAGVQSVEISLNGVMTNDTGYETLQGYVTANSINTMSMQWADLDGIEGSFASSGLEIGGEYNGEQTFSVTLMSSGQPTFTQA
jgi:predicted secreted protein